MNPSKSLGMKLGAMIGVALVPGLYWLRHEPAGDSEPATGSASIPGKPNQAVPEGRDNRKSGDKPVSVKALRSFTSDELVAIYESRGAAAAIEAAKGMTGPERASQVLFILTYLARIDPEVVAGELKGAGLDTAHQWHVVNAVMENWKDGKKALEWATSGFTGDLLKTAVGGALRILVRSDPQAALATRKDGFGMYQGPDVSWKTKTVATMENKDFWNWGGQDPEGARKFLETNPEGKGLAELATVVAAGISTKEGPEAAFHWTQTLQGKAE